MRPALSTAYLSARLADPVQRVRAIEEIAHACRGGVASGARFLGVCERTLWRWRSQFPDLANALDRSRGVA